MKKLFYSVFIMSSLFVGIAHAEDSMHGGSNMRMGIPPTTTVMHMDRDMGHGMPIMTGSGTPPMEGDHKWMMGSNTPPMMGGGAMPMCRKFSRGLALGLRGDDVKELQEMLREKGFLSASSTGFFGRMTREAVVKFQKEEGLNPSGFFGELSRKHHEKRCGEGKESEMGQGDGKKPWMSTSTMPVPCMVGASANGCENSNAFHPCLGMFSTTTGKPCPKPGMKEDDRDGRKPWVTGTGTPPTGIMCTMEARMCSDGTMMPRDNMCGWHPEKCGVQGSTTPTM